MSTFCIYPCRCALIDDRFECVSLNCTPRLKIYGIEFYSIKENSMEHCAGNGPTPFAKNNYVEFRNCRFPAMSKFGIVENNSSC